MTGAATMDSGPLTLTITSIRFEISSLFRGSFRRLDRPLAANSGGRYNRLIVWFARAGTIFQYQETGIA